MNQTVIQQALKTMSTPFYVFDTDAAAEKMVRLRGMLPKRVQLCYAMKANPFLIKPMDEYTDRFEVCSPGEYEICMRQGIAPDKIVVSGVNKTEQSMDRIMQLSEGKGIFTIESLAHYRILSACAKKYGRKISVYVRLSSGHQLEYGPGLSVAYFENDKAAPAEEQLRDLKNILDNAQVFSHISIEMGRFIASECGYYMTEVVDVKHTEDTRFLIVDGGIHQLNYYGQLMGMKKPQMTFLPERSENTGKYTMCGSLCTINDVIVRDLEIGEPQPGDVIVFGICGAYSVTEGMALFLSRELPQILFYSANKGFQCVRKPMGTDIINSQMEGN